MLHIFILLFYISHITFLLHCVELFFFGGWVLEGHIGGSCFNTVSTAINSSSSDLSSWAVTPATVSAGLVS